MRIQGPDAKKVREAEEKESVPRVQQTLKRNIKLQLAMAEIQGLKFKYVLSVNVFSLYHDLALTILGGLRGCNISAVIELQS